MIRAKVTILNKRGLHARAAAKFTGLCSNYQSSIQVSKAEQQVDGKNIMALMLLAASQGTELEIFIEGDDEQAACAALLTLINNRFEEEE